MLQPFPAFQLLPSLINSLASFQLFQSHESLGLLVAWKIYEFEKYLLFKTLDMSRFGFVINHHTCLPSSAMLKTSRSLNSSPHLFLESIILSQVIQCIPLSFSPLLHQNLAYNLVISLHTSFGIFKQDTGISWTSDFSINSLPEAFKSFVFQFFLFF